MLFNLPTTLWHVLYVKTVGVVVIDQHHDYGRRENQHRQLTHWHTETCVSYPLFDMMRNESRPFPPGLSVVVSSARRMKLPSSTVASPRLRASSWDT